MADEVLVTIEPTVDVVGCAACGARAEAYDRMPVDVRDLAYFGRPARLRWIKRRGVVPIPPATQLPRPSTPPTLRPC